MASRCSGEAWARACQGEAQVAVLRGLGESLEIVQGLHLGAPSRPAPVVDELVAGEGEQPGGRAAAVGPEGPGAGPDGGEDLLGDVLGEGGVPADTAGVGEDAAGVAQVELMEGFEVAAGDRGEQAGVVGLGGGGLIRPPLDRRV